MKVFLVWFFGVATASAWWAAAIWGYGKDLQVLWFIPAVLTIGSIGSAIAYAINVDKNNKL